MTIADIFNTAWPIATTVIAIASGLCAFVIPANATGALGIVRKVVEVASLTVGHAKATAAGSTPTVGQVVEAAVEETANAVTQTTSLPK